MNFDWSNLGKSVKPKTAAIVYENSPLSDDVFYLATGEVYGKITSYIEKKNSTGLTDKYLQLNDTEYILLTDKIEIVEPGAKDDSNFLSRAAAAAKGLQDRTENEITGTAKNLKEGWEKTKSRNLFELLDYAGFSDVKKAIVVGVAVMVLYGLIQIAIKIKG